MSLDDILERLRNSFDQLPPKLQEAARFLIDHPKEVALLSMREQARIVNVPPATMTRLAQWFGFSGFDELRALYADAIRADAGSFSSRSRMLVERRKTIGDAGLITEHIDIIISHLERLKSAGPLNALLAAAECLKSASTIYTLGVRSVFPVAYQIAYVHSYFSDDVILLDGPGSSGADRFERASQESVLLVISFDPYASSSLAIARDAHARGIRIVAITDSIMSPIGRIATVAIIAEKLSASFFDTIAPAFVAGEILVALLASADPEISAGIEGREDWLREIGVFWNNKQDRRGR